MMHRGVEVGVVADLYRQQELGIPLRHEGMPCGELTMSGGVHVQQVEQRPAQSAAGCRAHGHEGVERRRRTGAHRFPGQRLGLIAASGGQTRRHVEDLVANGDAHTRQFRGAGAAKDAKGEVLQRKVGVAVGRRHPTAGEAVVS